MSQLFQETTEDGNHSCALNICLIHLITATKKRYE